MTPKVDNSETHDLIALTGTPYQVGQQLGSMQRAERDAAWADKLWTLTQPFPIAGMTRSTYTSRYIQLLEKWAPHWLPEYQGLAQALDCPFDDLICLNAVRYILGPKSSITGNDDNCTSWIVMPDATAGGTMLLHKNRDGGSSCQGWYLKHIDGQLKWMGVSDFLSLGTLAGVNVAGVAAVMNNGENCRDVAYSGLSTPDILRVILERAHQATDAVELCKEIILAGNYAHGNSGSIFMVADAQRAFILENTARHVVAAELYTGFEVRSNDWLLPGMPALALPATVSRQISDRTRRQRAVEYLRERIVSHQGISLRDCRRLSRDRMYADTPAMGVPIANNSTTFGVTFALHPTHPDILTSISLIMGPPLYTPAIPLAFGVTGIPNSLSDSRIIQYAFQARLKKPYTFDWNKLEEQFENEFKIALNKAQNILLKSNSSVTNFLDTILINIVSKVDSKIQA